MTRVPLVQAAKQRFTVDSNNTRVNCELDYNGVGDFFSSSFSYGDRMISSRRVIPNVNMIPKSHTKEIGGFMVCNDIGNPNADRNALFSNELSFYQIEPRELSPANAKNDFIQTLMTSLTSIADESEDGLFTKIVDEATAIVDLTSEESIEQTLGETFDSVYALLCQGILGRRNNGFLDLDLCRGILRNTIQDVVRKTI